MQGIEREPWKQGRRLVTGPDGHASLQVQGWVECTWVGLLDHGTASELGVEWNLSLACGPIH